MKKFIATAQEIIIELIVLILKVIKAIIMLVALLGAIVLVSPFLLVGGLIRVIKFLFFTKPVYRKSFKDLNS